MARLFAFNSFAGAGRSSTLATDGDTTSGKFDSAYVSNCMKLAFGAEYITRGAPFDDGSSSVSTIHIKGDYICNSAASVISNFPLMYVLNGLVPAYRLFLLSGTNVQPQSWNGSAWVNWGTAFSITTDTLYTFVWKIVAGVSSNVYQGTTGNTSLVATAGAPTGSSQSAITEVRYGSVVSGASFWSQCMAADYDIRDARFMPMTLNGDSASNTAGTGAYTDVNEAVTSDATAITLAAAGKKGQTKAALTIPAGFAIIGAQLNARGRVAGGTITQGKHGWRSGGVNGSSGNRSYDAAYGPRGSLQTTDPNTGAAWAAAALNSAETYLEAV